MKRVPITFQCGWPYLDMKELGIPAPWPLTKENMAPHASTLCEDFGNRLRRALQMEECECPCHEGVEMASTLLEVGQP